MKIEKFGKIYEEDGNLVLEGFVFDIEYAGYADMVELVIERLEEARLSLVTHKERFGKSVGFSRIDIIP